MCQNESRGVATDGGNADDEDEDEDEETEMKNFRSEIEADVWDDFRRFTPRDVNLDEQVNNLIRQYVARQRELWDRIEEQTGARPGEIKISDEQLQSIGNDAGDADTESETDAEDN